MRKRFFGALVLFSIMAMAGAVLSLGMFGQAYACDNPNACSAEDCIPNRFPINWLSCMSGCGCTGATPHQVFECYGHCPMGGLCQCTQTGCIYNEFCD